MSSAHSNVAPATLDSNANSAFRRTVSAGGPDRIDVSGTTAGVAVAIAKADRLPGSPQTRPRSGSLVVVTSTHTLPSKCSRRTGSGSELGSYVRHTVSDPL